MLFTTRINDLVTAYPKLSRVWIKTGDLRTPLKGIWINESKLHAVMNDVCAPARDDEPAKLSDEHLCFAACAWGDPAASLICQRKLARLCWM